MKTLAEHMAFYGSYHRDLRNRLTHFVGVPSIILAVQIPMSLSSTGNLPLAISTGNAFHDQVYLPVQ